MKDGFYNNEEKIRRVKQEYLDGDLVMSECLAGGMIEDYDLSVEEIELLLAWSGDDEYVRVLPDKTLVCV